MIRKGLVALTVSTFVLSTAARALAAPPQTTVRWYDASHALTRNAYRDAFDWLAKKLPIDGPPVRGAAA